MEQHLIEKAGTLQNGINRTCDRLTTYKGPIARASSYEF